MPFALTTNPNTGGQAGMPVPRFVLPGRRRTGRDTRPTFTFCVAGAAEHARASGAGAPALRAEQVNLVVAKIQRARAAGAGFAERRIERAQDRVPGERHLA